MSRKSIISIFKKYRKASPHSKLRRGYFRAFEEKMIYRTTKTENPTTTPGMVRRVLERLRHKVWYES